MEIDMTALRMVENEKGVSLETLVDAIEEALLKAYHNLPGAISQARIEIDKKTGRVTVMAMDEDEDGNPIGEFDDTPKNFGRIAQSTARSVIMQRLRDADDQRVFGDFAGREGQIITGTVQAPRPGRPTMVQVSDDFEAVLPDGEKVPGESYRHGDRIRAYVVGVERTERGPRITLSRTHPNLVAGLFQREVPEIQQGLVKIKAIAREAGHRTKIAVAATREGINAKGACIGPMRACAPSWPSWAGRRSTSSTTPTIRRASWPTRCRPRALLASSSTPWTIARRRPSSPTSSCPSPSARKARMRASPRA